MSNPKKQAARPLALVTGASSGIGLHIARELAERGYDLVIAAEDKKLGSAADIIGATAGAHVHAYTADLRTKKGVEGLYKAVTGDGRPLAVAALNAGVGQGGPFVETRLADDLEIVDLNVRSTVHLAKLVLRDMAARGEGKVLFTSSVASMIPGANQSVYHASKAFVQSFAEALRSELSDHGVTVTALLPGPTQTDFFHRAGMDLTKVGKSKKDDPARVARQGVEAMLKGSQQKLGGSLPTRLMSASAKFMPDRAKAAVNKVISR
jgi:short-subunit dehydrogenase